MKKIKYLVIMLMMGICLVGVSCSSNNTKSVVSITQNDAGKLVVEYSDGTTSEITVPAGEDGAQGPKGDTGEKGEQGEQGEQGPKGDDAKPIEFRYYKAKLWWRYVGTDAWIALVSADELNVENAKLEDFAMNVYSEDYDVSIKVGNSVEVNGSWVQSTIAGNTLTVPYTVGETTTYFDVTIGGVNGTTIITYETEGVNEQEVAVVDNNPITDYIGTYTLVGPDQSEVVVEITEYSVNITTTSQIYMTSYGKGDVLYAKQNYDGEATVVITKTADGLTFETSLPNADGEYVPCSDYTITKWVDVAEVMGIYTVYTNDVETFDVSLGNYGSLDLYDDTYNTYEYAVDTASFTYNGIEYKFKYVDGVIQASSDVEGAVITIKKWDDLTIALNKFTTIDSNLNTIDWSIDEYGSCYKGDDYYGDSSQRKNVITCEPYNKSSSLVITYDETTATYTGVYHENGSETQLTIAMYVTIEDFLGIYTGSYTANGGTSTVNFEIGMNPYDEGQYAIIIAGNPYSSYTIADRQFTYINNRGGYGYQITANYDGSKSVVYFLVDENNDPDPATFINCTINYTPGA